MEHYKSTLAVTGIAVLGLLTAAGIRHPAYLERPARPAAESRAVAPGPTAWIDPPASLRAAARRGTRLSDAAALMKPEPMVALSADDAMVQPLPAELTLVATTARPARATHGAGAARRAATTRQAALARPTADGTGIAAPQAGGDGGRDDAGRTTAQKIDPIGDLMRGLGLIDRS